MLCLKPAHSGLRIGCLTLNRTGSEISENCSNISCPTSVDIPNCAIFTKAGSIPFIHHDLAEHFKSIPKLALVSLSSTLHCSDVLESFPEGARSFFNLKDFALISLLRDATESAFSTKSDASFVKLRSRSGNTLLEASSWKELVDKVKPQFAQVLAHKFDVDDLKSVKRKLKLQTKNKQFVESCCQQANESNVQVLLTLQNDGSAKELLELGRARLGRDPTGVVLDILQSNSTDAFKKSKAKEIIESFQNFLPKSSFRLLPGVITPADVIEGVQLGVDLFDTSYALVLTERGAAMTFNYDLTKADDLRTTQIDLTDSKYEDDFAPVVEGCTCYCCVNHKRAYIHHLLKTNELLSRILLMLHNLHHYTAFFSELRRSLEQNQFTSFANLITSQGDQCLSNALD